MPARTSNKVKVYVRTRPTNNFASDMISIGRDNRTISIHRTPSASVVDNKINDWTFHLDGVLNNVNQEEIFNAVAKDVIDRTMDGYNGTIMCYGQTGAGKTHTMTGFTESYQNRGIIPRTIQHLFQEISARQEHSYSIRIAYLEIYNDQMCDLLRTLSSESEYQQQQQQLSIGEDSGLVYVKGLSYRIANSEEEALNLLFEGETNRAIGQHVLNKQSSRSHCIFTILIECRSMLSAEDKYTISKLNLVDLAGSERLAKTNSEGMTKREATFINKSLSFLEQAVLNLSDKKGNTVHFRSSKLTHALKDSIGGRCNTVMIANIWPELQHLEETVSTLRFASRMMCVPAEPTVNEVIDPVKAIENYKRENKYLRDELAVHDKLLNRHGVSYEPLTDQQLQEIENQCRRFIDGSLDEIEVQSLRQVQAIFNAFRNICRTNERDGERNHHDRFAPTGKHNYEPHENQREYSYFNSAVHLTDDNHNGQNLGMNAAGKDPRANNAALRGGKGKGVPPADAAPVPKLTNTKDQPLPGGMRGKAPGRATQGRTADEEQFSRVNDGSDSSDVREQRPLVPSARAAAFEEFKQTRGMALNKIYMENKESVAAKKRQFSDLARRINQTKAEIDKTRIAAERKKNERLNMGEFLNENGETIIDEEEYQLIAKLQELKGIYRTDYDQWKNLKSEISYSQNLVTQYQNRLLQEFDDWYNERYSNGHQSGASNSSVPSTHPQYDYRYHDDADRFDHMQKELVLSDLDSTPFRQAQARTNRRHIFDGATNQGTWKQSPSTTTIRVNSDASYSGNYGQDPSNISSIPMNGGRQKPMVR